VLSQKGAAADGVAPPRQVSGTVTSGAGAAWQRPKRREPLRPSAMPAWIQRAQRSLPASRCSTAEPSPSPSSLELTGRWKAPVRQRRRSTFGGWAYWLPIRVRSSDGAKSPAANRWHLRGPIYEGSANGTKRSNQRATDRCLRCLQSTSSAASAGGSRSNRRAANNVLSKPSTAAVGEGSASTRTSRRPSGSTHTGYGQESSRYRVRVPYSPP
jgi:hypothetical protein